MSRRASVLILHFEDWCCFQGIIRVSLYSGELYCNCQPNGHVYFLPDVIRECSRRGSSVDLRIARAYAHRVEAHILFLEFVRRVVRSSVTSKRRDWI